MARDWYIAQNEKTYGPYRSSKLKELASVGRLSADARVANNPDGPWHPVSSVKGLTTASAPSAPHAPPPKPVSAAPQTSPPPPSPEVTSAPAPIKSPAPQSAAQITASERSVWSGRPSQITNIKTFILCGLFCWLIVPLFVAAWRWLAIRCMTYELTTQRFKVSHGVLSRRTDELELYRVKDTSFSQDLFQRIFGLASVIMTTSDASTPTVAIHSIGASQAKNLREQIRAFTEELRDRKRVREVDYE